MLALLRDNAGGILSNFATRMTGSQDLLAARWDGGLPGGLAAGRRPSFGVNALEAPLSGSLLQLVGADDDLDRAEVVARSLLLAVLVAQVGLSGTLQHCWLSVLATVVLQNLMYGQLVVGEVSLFVSTSPAGGLSCLHCAVSATS